MKKSLAITIICILAVAAVALGVLYFTDGARKTEEIEALRTESERMSSMNELLNEDVQQRDTSIQALQTEKEEQAALIDRLNTEIAEKAGQIDTLTADIAEKTASIETLNTDITEKTAQIGNLTADLKTRDEEVTALNAEKEKLNGQMEELNTAIAEQLVQIETLTAENGEKDNQVNILGSALEEKGQQIEKYAAEADTKEKKITELTDELESTAAAQKELEDAITSMAFEAENEKKKAIEEAEAEKAIAVEEAKKAAEEEYEKALVDAKILIKETAKGFGGPVTVKVILDGKTVKKLDIEAVDETPGLGQRASEETFTGRFIGKEGPFTYGEDGIEAITGATVTSNAVLDALNRVFPAETAEEPAEEPAAEPEGVKTVFETDEQGFGGMVTVKVTLIGTTVKELTIDTPNETRGLGQKASEEAFTSQFIGKKGPFTYGENGVEAITGATVTSNAVLKALNRVFTGTEPAAEEPKEEAEPAEEPKTEAEETGRIYYGSYMAKRETNFSTIKVVINSKGGRITECRITSEAKVEGSDFLTDEVREAWAKAIVENGTADVDVITGATLKFSAEAVVDAVNEILGEIQ